ncbi:MAG TPA: Grx4 family monothiol glutaredoxin [Enhygromyxa sp.]|nr:Grx4 family monothiol glutaredoxin [Enhygromyxa sp.]
MADEALPPTTREKIEALVASDRVVLFMKGVRRAPQCGFSASVIELLDEWLDEYATVDVLADPELREGIKLFSDWPTIPQLYVGGEFVGGADIIRELDQTGELAATLGAEPTAFEPPTVTITDAAAEQFRAAFAGPDIDESDRLRLTIDSRFRNDLSIGAQRPGDLAVQANGLTLLMDRKSARRAGGLTIDFVETAEGVGFKIDNPNAPPEVRAISVRELARRLKEAEAAGTPLQLYDVRTPGERAIAAIPGGVLLDAEVAEQIDTLARDTPLYFHCHHGGRSQRAAEHFIGLGFREVYNVTGGIDAWSQEVDPSVERY